MHGVRGRVLQIMRFSSEVRAPSEAALFIFEQANTLIDLLVTDVILPGMNGSELREKLLEESPSLKTLFISGYTAEFIAQKGVLGEGMHFLPKPFTRAEVARKVKEVLG